VNSKGVIVHKSQHAKGGTHDYALFKRSHPALPSGVDLGLDLGYQGVLVDFPGISCLLAFKCKSLGRGERGVKVDGFCEDQKLFNRFLSSARVVVEHGNSRVKKFRVFGRSLGIVLGIMML
jgi:hypothetical protein